ncbi:MAG TPA: hypothetical protein PKC49_03495 [Phycisphaerae bacterium]|nr:hypothetical protein [Phycisphaerae bacterium]
MAKSEAQKTTERRKLSDADLLMIHSVQKAEARIREQEAVVDELARKLSGARRELRDRVLELRNSASPDASPLFD